MSQNKRDVGIIWKKLRSDIYKFFFLEVGNSQENVLIFIIISKKKKQRGVNTLNLFLFLSS